jgi:photosystem II stability/assembly factor-like uncharacterized protein
LYGISFTSACTDTSGNVLVVGVGGKALYSSNAGASWSNVTTPFTTAISWCSYSGGNWLLNSDTQLEYSADLANWSEVSEAPLATSLKSVAYANGKWLAVGSNGAVLQSSDGQSWSTLDVGAGTSTLNALAHHGTTWVIAGSSGLAISTFVKIDVA